MTTASVAPEAPWHAGLRAARANLLPGFVLQALALALVLSYYWQEPVRTAFAQLTAVRAHTGLLFGLVSTGFCGGIVPFLYLRFGANDGMQLGWRQGAFLTVFWAYKGIEIELWYRLLVQVVGSGHDAGTIVCKTILDQFVYCPLFAVPSTVLAYAWSEDGFATGRTLADIRTPRWYARRVLPTLISNISVWVPAVAIIYALPTPLQLPMQNVVLCFFTLLLAHLTRHARR